MPVNFPNIKPTARSYRPGQYPQTFFQSINGATSVIQFGAQEFNAELTLQFSNIEDSQAEEIILTYENANKRWDYIDFRAAGALDCTGTSTGGGKIGMKKRMSEFRRVSGRDIPVLKWRFAEPPSVTYKFRNLCDVSCSFIAYLDGT